MKLETKEDWIKEARFLFLLLKEEHENSINQQIVLQINTPLANGEAVKIVETSWKMYCIEKNITPEDYEPKTS